MYIHAYRCARPCVYIHIYRAQVGAKKRKNELLIGKGCRQQKNGKENHGWQQLAVEVLSQLKSTNHLSLGLLSTIVR